jgi:hypothetical protein
MTSLPYSPRRRGALPGKMNAVKHGYYAKHYSPAEIEDLENRPVECINDEINLLRIFTRRTLGLSRPDMTFSQTIELLHVLVEVCTCINRLIRTQLLLNPPEDARDEIRQLLAQIGEELEWKDTPSSLINPEG